MKKPNILDDPRFSDMLKNLFDQSDGPVGPYIDGRILRGLFAAGFEGVSGIEYTTPEEARTETIFGRGQASYVRSLDSGFRYDHISTALDDGTTVLKPTSIAITEPGRWLMVWSGSGSSSDTYTNLLPTPISVGGIGLGESFNTETITQVFNRLFYPYQDPAFSSFSISGQVNPIEVGGQILATITFLWGTTNPANVVPNSLAIRDQTGGVNLATGLANDGTEVVAMGAPIQKTVPASHVFRITGQSTKPGSFLRDSTYNWYWRLYSGTNVSPTLTEAQIEALANSLLTGTFTRTYNFAGGGYKYVCYPSSFGWATTWRDQLTGFNVPFTNIGTVSVTNTFGQNTNYNVQRSTNILGGSINIIVS